MTGFGEAAARIGCHEVTVTLRSVNHRHLDLAMRMGAPYRPLEAMLREVVAEQVHRGRVDLGLEVEAASPRSRLEVDDEIAESLQQAARRWRRRGLVRSELLAGELFRAPGVLRSAPVSGLFRPEERDEVVALCRRALAALVAERGREGRVLASVLERNLDALRRVVQQLSTRRRDIAAGLADDFERRLNELFEARGLRGAGPGEIAPERLVQEVGFIVERGDVAEELDRLDGHIAGFRDAMAGDGAIGRRLDFLIQELLRELNTVGSKCRDLEMQRCVVEGKVLCEQLREQVQNVE